ncbi:hypothetical protein [Rossellomorea marisflavi]|uniref:hypothetical protein n=1 Tax=Rossellomorea marisflavi TaxID=189381 RepID=UPI002079F69D|nr:hypothetical protein [Rossellomorea marisflavi]USK91209.1 hypothetical protein LIT29_17060 [Rossellomorea marisflavi]
MKKNTWIILAAAIIFILLFAWLLSRESGVEKVLNHYTKEKYGFNVTIMSTKHEHPTIFIVKRTDQPEVVFLMEMEEKIFSSKVLYDNYGEAGLLLEFNKWLEDSPEAATLKTLGFEHPHLTNYYRDGDTWDLHDLETALFLYRKMPLEESDAEALAGAASSLTTIKDELTKTGFELTIVEVNELSDYPALYEHQSDVISTKNTRTFNFRQLEGIDSAEDARKLLD